MPTTVYSEMMRQNAPASGVPTGLPSYMTVVAPASNGRVDDVGVARPPSRRREAVHHTCPGLMSYRFFMVHVSATAWPPLSRTTPLGLPVVPEV